MQTERALCCAASGGYRILLYCMEEQDELGEEWVDVDGRRKLQGGGFFAASASSPSTQREGEEGCGCGGKEDKNVKNCNPTVMRCLGLRTAPPPDQSEAPKQPTWSQKEDRDSYTNTHCTFLVEARLQRPSKPSEKIHMAPLGAKHATTVSTMIEQYHIPSELLSNDLSRMRVGG